MKSIIDILGNPIKIDNCLNIHPSGKKIGDSTWIMHNNLLRLDHVDVEHVEFEIIYVSRYTVVYIQCIYIYIEKHK